MRKVNVMLDFRVKYKCVTSFIAQHLKDFRVVLSDREPGAQKISGWNFKLNKEVYRECGQYRENIIISMPHTLKCKEDAIGQFLYVHRVETTDHLQFCECEVFGTRKWNL